MLKGKILNYMKPKMNKKFSEIDSDFGKSCMTVT